MFAPGKKRPSDWTLLVEKYDAFYRNVSFRYLSAWHEFSADQYTATVY